MPDRAIAAFLAEGLGGLAHDREPTPYRIIHTESYLFGFLAYEKEQRILAQHAAHKYTGANLLVSGNTELFTSDILNLDKAAHKQSPLPDRRSA
jgi:hypothetical protein